MRPDPVHLIQSHNPVPDAHQLPDGPCSASAEALFEEIIGMEDQTTTSTRRRPRMRRVAALAAAFLVLTAGGAIAAGVFSPDPEDVATIVDDGQLQDPSHLEGWRPSLRSEGVWCMYDLATGSGTYVSEYPLGDPLTMDVLLAECATGNDVARNQDGIPTEFTLCEATITEQGYSDRIDQDEHFTVLEGNPTGEHPGFPVVLAWDAECEATTLETSTPVNLVTMKSLDDINRAREVEIGLKASGIESCLTKAEAIAMAQQTRSQLGDSWLVMDFVFSGTAECHSVDIDPEWGTIGVWAKDNPTAGESDPGTLTTEAPSTTQPPSNK